MNGVFHLFCNHLGQINITQLLEFVKEKHLYPDYSESTVFTVKERSCLTCFEEKNGLPPSDVFSICPPSSMAALSHWRILSNLLNLLTPAAQRDIQQLYCPLYISGIKYTETPEYDIESTSNNFQFSDSHFHLDLLLKRSNHRNFSSLELYVNNALFELQLGIANCLP